MWLDLLLLLLGLALLIGGGEGLVRGASALAHRLGVSSVIIGLTVVAFGTSTPELMVNLTAVWRGQADIGFGNIIGSNIANIGLLLGVTVLCRPLKVHSTVIARELPMMGLSTLVALALAGDLFLSGRTGEFDRGDGLVLLLLFGVFLYYTVRDALRQRAGDPLMDEAQTVGEGESAASLPMSLLLVSLGLAAVILGGRWTVDGAVGLAEAAGIPTVIIALTMVAVGTSLPELATSLIAMRRGHDDLAVGNIVGSNLYNLLFIMGLSSAVAPAAIPEGGMIDILVMIGLSLLLLPLSITHQRRLTRWEGGLLLAIYAGYVIYLASRA